MFLGVFPMNLGKSAQSGEARLLREKAPACELEKSALVRSFSLGDSQSQKSAPDCALFLRREIAAGEPLSFRAARPPLQKDSPFLRYLSVERLPRRVVRGGAAD
jgi:hypothetical protein